jgi:glycerol-3-phosphate dehydrogenase (NAD(P)+)
MVSAMRISVLGAGAWGTALARSLADRHEVVLWARDPAQASALRDDRVNQRYLPGFALPPTLRVDADLAASLAGAQLAILAVPTGALRPVLTQLHALDVRCPCAWLSKGLERESGLLAHQMVAEFLPDRPVGPLSGPSFAEEVASGLPTALVVAGEPDFCALVTEAVHGPKLRVYSTDDVVGVEIGGAVKNVMAIGTGIADAMHLGLNARAALMTRGLSEARRLGEALGARAETFLGLTGMGDLILTCTGDLSRNRQIGLALGRGVALSDAVASLGHVAEGVWSAPAIVSRARSAGVEMPITQAICDVLDGRLSPRESAHRLLSRDPRAEHH